MRISLSDVVETAKKVAEQHPDNKNATNETETGCVYTDKDGNHCFAGEMLTLWNLPCPEYNSTENTKPIAELLAGMKDISFEDNVLYLMTLIQNRADDMLYWDEVLEEARSNFSMNFLKEI